MSKLALVMGALVHEIIPQGGDLPPIAERYHPDFVAGLVAVPDEVETGWVQDVGVWGPPPAPEAMRVVPEEITRRQMLLAMQSAGLITGVEALAAATVGAVPAAIDAVFDALPPDQALGARVTWATMGTAARYHPLILALIEAELATPEQVDAIFVAGATLLTQECLTAWPAEASTPVRRNWVVDVGDDRPRLMRWRDGSGPVDLAAVDLVLKMVWTEGDLELRSGTDAGLYKLDQARYPGWFGFRLSLEQGLLLPIDYPARYDLRALRLGLRYPLSRGSLTALRGDNLDV